LITKVRDVSVLSQERLNGLTSLCTEKQLLDGINTNSIITTLYSGVVEEIVSSDLYIVVFSVAFMLYFTLIKVSLLVIMNFIDEVK
jgi:hypothetical protein